MESSFSIHPIGMTKLLKITFLLFIAIKSNAQLPTIVSNSSEYQKKNAIVYRTLKDKYDFIISFSLSSGWKIGDTSIFYIVAKKNNSWSRINFKISGRNPLGIPKLEIKSFEKKKAKKLINDLTTLGFWSLVNDSLNMREIKPKNSLENYVIKDTVVITAGRIRSFSVADGTGYNFEIFQGDKLRRISCYSPDSYLRFAPEIGSTLIFIKSKDIFEKAIKINQ
jgi:hypothetical protein